MRIFQFTTSQGGRRDSTQALTYTEPFQFTTSQGGRHADAGHPEKRWSLSIHDLTRRSTGTIVEHLENLITFNSRPHKEVDQNYAASTYKSDLSIHDLTRRSTRWFKGIKIKEVLSIHDLTRRSTFCNAFSKVCDCLSIHDLTRRSTFAEKPQAHGWTLSIHDLTRRSTISYPFFIAILFPFNSRPHKEVDTLNC